MATTHELHPLYLQAPILIHSTGEKVTKERMESIFKHMNVEFDIKMAERFELPPQEYDNFYLKMSN